MASKKLPTANYKGTRDFYPEDMQFRNWMFSKMETVAESYGYGKYDSPLLESIDLYRAKTGEEIVQKQLYDFIDKGERHVAIRPEMTPSLARMVAARSRELPKPIRWYSIPNLWRYEAPGKGRLREHWQLNVDIFGVNTYRAEVEILQMACDILFAFGAPAESFAVKVSDRRVLNSFFSNTLQLAEDKAQPLAKLLDKRNKISSEEFEKELQGILPDCEKQKPVVMQYLDCSLETIVQIPGIDEKAIADLQFLFTELKSLGVEAQVDFDPSIIRGFDYYTGFIFEIFDTDPENRRSLYGGGRYDNLIGLFSNDQLSGIGFGLGDVTLENFLRTHGLVPEQLGKTHKVFMPLLAEENFAASMQLAKKLRERGVICETMLEGKPKLGKQFAIAEKKGYRYLAILGEDEIQKNTVTLKDLVSGEQSEYKQDEVAEIILGK
ncbi:MAG: histidine--tRNA ligase [Spirochaetota bacterium]